MGFQNKFLSLFIGFGFLFTSAISAHESEKNEQDLVAYRGGGGYHGGYHGGGGFHGGYHGGYGYHGHYWGHPHYWYHDHAWGHPHYWGHDGWAPFYHNYYYAPYNSAIFASPISTCCYDPFWYTSDAGFYLNFTIR